MALAATYPCLISGVPRGDDTSTHIGYQHAFDLQRNQGEFYPRWLSEVNFGTGSPIFFFQYPLPYFVSHALQRALPIHDVVNREAHAMGLYLTLSALLAGSFAYLWGKQLVGWFAGLVAALVYLTLPYSLSVDLYGRAAIGEYGALAWLPLALFFASGLPKRPRLACAGIAVTFGLLVLIHRDLVRAGTGFLRNLRMQ